VGDRLPINARVGAHLTGGLDSSTVICLAASRLRESAQSLMGFSWTTLPQPTDDPEEGELPFIAAVCAQAGITRYAPQITPEAMRDVILLRSGPSGVMPLPASEMAMHELMHEQGTRVVLSVGLGRRRSGIIQWAGLLGRPGPARVLATSGAGAPLATPAKRRPSAWPVTREGAGTVAA